MRINEVGTLEWTMETGHVEDDVVDTLDAAVTCQLGKAGALKRDGGNLRLPQRLEQLDEAANESL
jgi:hypothetical protein